MRVRAIESGQNAHLKALRKALSGSRGGGELAGIEGPHLLEEALRARLRIRTVFIAHEAEHLLNTLALAPEIDVLAVPRILLNQALSTETPQPIAALIEPPEWTWAHLLPTKKSDAALVIALAGIQDPGNLGTIVRSAEAFGARGIVCLPGTVSAWNPKAVRASAGSVFRVPLIAASERECLEQFRKAGVRVVATTLRGAQPADLVDLRAAVALVIGNEGNGVPADLIAKADAAITIPCPGPVESLNAAVAASVLLYEAARQRAALAGDPAPNKPMHSSKSLPHAVGARR